MSLSRFHLTAESWQPETLTLSGDEAAHCYRVLRREIGDAIEIFDGRGRVATAEITAISKTSVTARINSLHQHEPRRYEIHLMPAMIKAEPFEWMLEKAVELGAASIQPVISTRTIVHLSGENLEKKMLKWQRHMIESAKQCHTPWLPRLEKPRPLAEIFSALPNDVVKVIPALSEHSRSLHEIQLTGVTSVCTLIGPEGDFTTEEEVMAQQQGFQPITLGPLILRAETAAITTLAILSHELRRG
jgi:16S rRNA (uracil1498-N3)-methyltransferase